MVEEGCMNFQLNWDEKTPAKSRKCGKKWLPNRASDSNQMLPECGLLHALRLLRLKSDVTL